MTHTMGVEGGGIRSPPEWRLRGGWGGGGGGGYSAKTHPPPHLREWLVQAGAAPTAAAAAGEVRAAAAPATAGRRAVGGGGTMPQNARNHSATPKRRNPGIGGGSGSAGVQRRGSLGANFLCRLR